jgi:hypothetical protein
LQKIDEDKSVVAGSAISAVRRKDVSTSYIRAMTQDDRLLRDQHVSQFRFQENVLKDPIATGRIHWYKFEQYIDTLAAFTTVFDEDRCIDRSEGKQRAPESLDEKVAFTAYV